MPVPSRAPYAAGLVGHKRSDLSYSQLTLVGPPHRCTTVPVSRLLTARRRIRIPHVATPPSGATDAVLMVEGAVSHPAGRPSQAHHIGGERARHATRASDQDRRRTSRQELT